jgi:Protein of unknown function (DUF1569)
MLGLGTREIEERCMSTVIDTRKVKVRRQLRFESLDDIAAEVERLAASKSVRAVGNWSSGQVLQHLTQTMENSIDGFPIFVPVPVRWLLRTFMKRRFLTKSMPPGFKLPPKAEKMLPPPTDWNVALANFRRAMQRVKSEVRRSPHPAFGPLTVEEWEQVHCRHSELHLGFLIPGDQ